MLCYVLFTLVPSDCCDFVLRERKHLKIIWGACIQTPSLFPPKLISSGAYERREAVHKLLISRMNTCWLSTTHTCH